VQDWSGGTNLSACLHEFNQHWACRLLRSDSTVLLITGGLAQGSEADCKRPLWLNPLLRFDGFEPKAAGVRALLPVVTQHLPLHNLASLQEPVKLLSQDPPWI
jgi:uncharacterized protein with von Willebrand factor type A (vWA) domain